MWWSILLFLAAFAVIVNRRGFTCGGREEDLGGTQRPDTVRGSGGGPTTRNQLGPSA